MQAKVKKIDLTNVAGQRDKVIEVLRGLSHYSWGHYDPKAIDALHLPPEESKK